MPQLLSEPALSAWYSTFSAPRSTAFRLNPLRGGADVLAELDRDGLASTAMGWPAEAWSVEPSLRRQLTDCAAAREGRIYIQTPSSMVPVDVLDPQPGEEILDLAAAPGGKTTHIAARMNNEGRIGAVESVKGRFHRLRRNLERCGVTIADTYLADGAGVGRKVPERFDRVLLDAPCTSEGRFHSSDPSSYAYWSRKKIREMARKQKKLAHSAVHALKPGGVLVYCTCTLAPEENEAIVHGMLKRFPGALEVEPIPDVPTDRTEPGRSEWDGTEYDDAVTRTVRVLSGQGMEAFFVARLRKTGPV